MLKGDVPHTFGLVRELKMLRETPLTGRFSSWYHLQTDISHCEVFWNSFLYKLRFRSRAISGTRRLLWTLSIIGPRMHVGLLLYNHWHLNRTKLLCSSSMTVISNGAPCWSVWVGNCSGDRALRLAWHWQQLWAFKVLVVGFQVLPDILPVPMTLKSQNFKNIAPLAILGLIQSGIVYKWKAAYSELKS